jgi:hypothetical protein
MVFNATFNNISVITWWSVLFVEERGVPGENHRPVASHRQLNFFFIDHSSGKITFPENKFFNHIIFQVI